MCLDKTERALGLAPRPQSPSLPNRFPLPILVWGDILNLGEISPPPQHTTPHSFPTSGFTNLLKLARNLVDRYKNVACCHGTFSGCGELLTPDPSWHSPPSPSPPYNPLTGNTRRTVIILLRWLAWWSEWEKAPWGPLLSVELGNLAWSSSAAQAQTAIEL